MRNFDKPLSEGRAREVFVTCGVFFWQMVGMFGDR